MEIYGESRIEKEMMMVIAKGKSSGLPFVMCKTIITVRKQRFWENKPSRFLKSVLTNGKMSDNILSY